MTAAVGGATRSTSQGAQPKRAADKEFADKQAYVEKYIREEITERWRSTSLVPKGKNPGTISFMPTQSIA